MLGHKRLRFIVKELVGRIKRTKMQLKMLVAVLSNIKINIHNYKKLKVILLDKPLNYKIILKS